MSRSEPSAGFEGETVRVQGSSVFVVNSGALGTSQVLQELSPTRNTSILPLEPPLISWLTLGESPTSCF